MKSFREGVWKIPKRDVLLKTFGLMQTLYRVFLSHVIQHGNFIAHAST